MKRALSIIAAITLCGVSLADWTIGVSGNVIAVDGNVVQSASVGWWEGLGLTSVWPLTSDGNDAVGAIDGTWAGTEAYSSASGVTAAYFNGSSWLDMGDSYDLGTAGVALGGWFWYQNESTHVASFIGKGDGAAPADGHYMVYRSVNTIRVDGIVDTDAGNSSGADLNVPTNQWIYISIAFVKSAGNMTAMLIVKDRAPSVGTPRATTADYNTAAAFRIANNSAGNRRIVGWGRDCWLKVNGTTNDCKAVYQATKATYGL